MTNQEPSNISAYQPEEFSGQRWEKFINYAYSQGCLDEETAGQELQEEGDLIAQEEDPFAFLYEEQEENQE